ncbi:MAG: chromosome segregation protein SMC [Clostridia bacterium]|nr:chromosome segregation protein SMC [Clostridia bacterium]
MRLKSLELFGFKSFPDRTLLDFNSGMTVVVGPNGSGKSNISDAIRWVLGELSAKSVRGTKMEDVIFSGSDGRKALPYAEVTLTIDNTDGIGSGKLDSEYDEVSVTRRCYRSGESEYLINRKTARLRDIAELFMNTGVGKTGYSIIGQGRIAEIISQKSEERRIIFEEAAGISKYRFKKNEAERKLLGVDDNLIRLNDILGELSARLGPLERESEKARKYLDIYEKKKQTDVALWLYDLDAVRVQIDKVETEYISAKSLFDDAEEALNTLEARSERLFSLAQESKLNAGRTSERIAKYRERKSALDSAKMVLDNDIRHLEQQILDTQNEIKVKKSAIVEAEERKEAQKATSAEILSELYELETKYEADNASLEQMREKRASIEVKQDALRREIEQGRLSLSDAKVRRAALESSISSIEGRREQLTESIGESRSRLELIESRIERAEKSLKDYSENEEKIKAELSEIEGSIASKRDEAAKIEEELNALNFDRMSKKQRADTLRRMDELFEGYNHSVKAIMRASDHGEIKGIYGPVSKLIDVKEKHAVAIETAVGANIQNIVVTDENAAKSAISYLKQNNAGRATFYPLTSISPLTLNIGRDTLEKYKGYIGIASELVECDAKFTAVIEYMLGRTVVFDTLENATVMAKATGYRTRIVTLDGQLINAGGSFTGGSVKKDTGMLTRSSEISRIDAEIARADVEIAAAQKRLDSANAALGEAQDKINDINDRLAIIARLYQAENTQYQVLISQRDSDKESISSLENELNSLSDAVNNADSDMAVIDIEIAKLGEMIDNSVKEESETESARIEITKLITKASDALTTLRLKAAERKKDHEASENTVSLTDLTIASLNEQLSKSESVIKERHGRIADLKNRIILTEADEKALSDDIDNLTRELAELNSTSGRQDAELSELRAKIKEQGNKRENLFFEYNRLENKREQVKNEFDKLTEKLWEEYELSPSGAKELNYTPVTEANRREAATLQNELRSKLKALGNVNTSAIEEFKEVRERHEFMSEQIGDLEKSKNELLSIIDNLEREMRERFTETIDSLSISFNTVFRELFGGGSAELKLTDPTDVLQSGIEINVAPPGKIIKSLSLLSGGEQSFVAIALFFAILNINPTPFCVLDEIEAALDDVIVARFAEYARRYSPHTQFVIITHRRGTMERADTIYGVTMPRRGVSKVLTLDIGEVEEKLGVKL